jgi:hypothetical protein
MTRIPISLAVIASTILGAAAISLLVQRCAMFEFLHVCLYH